MPHYYHKDHVEWVRVKPRRQQLKCKHIWKYREWNERSSGWKSICSKCGLCSRAH